MRKFNGLIIRSKPNTVRRRTGGREELLDAWDFSRGEKGGGFKEWIGGQRLGQRRLGDKEERKMCGPVVALCQRERESSGETELGSKGGGEGAGKTHKQSKGDKGERCHNAH